jgi:hypothetical protein
MLHYYQCKSFGIVNACTTSSTYDTLCLTILQTFPRRQQHCSTFGEKKIIVDFAFFLRHASFHRMQQTINLILSLKSIQHNAQCYNKNRYLK